MQRPIEEQIDLEAPFTPVFTAEFIARMQFTMPRTLRLVPHSLRGRVSICECAAEGKQISPKTEAEKVGTLIVHISNLSEAAWIKIAEAQGAGVTVQLNCSGCPLQA
jgi:hypothetical protein